MGRSPCCDKDGLKKGPWTPEEDLQLTTYIQMHGPGNWRALPKKAGLQRCGKSCRLRWTNYLRPDIKRGRFSFEEEETIIQLHSIMGNKWSAIAARLPGRTDNEIKNYWNTHIRKRLLRMGLDPVTHSPRLDLLDLSTILNSSLFNPSHHLNLSNLNLLGMQQQLVNPDFLRLASTLLSLKQEQNQLGFLQSIQENQTSNTSSQTLIPPLQSNQFQTPPTTFVEQAQFMQANNFNGFTSNVTNFSCPSSTENLVPSSETNYGFVDHDDQKNMLSKDTSNFQPLNMSDNYPITNFTFDSVLSTPSSSANALNSTSTTYINSNSNDDERDSYCSNMLNFEIPGSLDISDFL